MDLFKFCVDEVQQADLEGEDLDRANELKELVNEALSLYENGGQINHSLISNIYRVASELSDVDEKLEKPMDRLHELFPFLGNEEQPTVQP